MLCEVFKHADKWYGIKEACDEIETNPEKYCRLTDNIIYEVLRLRDREDAGILTDYPDLIQARLLMKNIQTRNIYKFVSDVDDLDIQPGEAVEFIKKSAK